MSKTEFTNEDLRSGYMVEFRNGVRRLVTRVGSFTRILVNPESGDWNYLSQWDEGLKIKAKIHCNPAECQIGLDEKDAYDIVKVYGLPGFTGNYENCLRANVPLDTLLGRKLLWERKDPVKMTVAEICAKLGYEVEIVAEGCK